MMQEYDCTACKGTGKEEFDPETDTIFEKPVVAEAVKVIEKQSTKPQPKTIPVEPIMNINAPSKSRKKK